MIKRSVSFVIRDPAEPDRVLAVQRPADDEDLPDAWGLPAGSLREGESWDDALRRAGREKLGVELAVGGALTEGTLERSGYTLHMRLHEARIVAGAPLVPQPVPGVTQYAALAWLTGEAFRPAASAGSLCCRLYLESIG